MLKRASEAEIAQRLQMALSASESGVWEMNLSNDTFVYDLTCAKLFEFDEDSDSMTIEELIAYFERTIADGSKEDIIEGLRLRDPYKTDKVRDFLIKTADGGIRYIRTYGNTLRGEDGKANRIIGMCTDTTQAVQMELELKAAKEAAENANRLKNLFLSNMSCEIRIPMNDIIGMSDMLYNERLTDRQREYLNDIRLSSASLLCIINDILDFSKIEEGKLEIIPSDYSLPNMLESLRSMFSFSTQEKSISFEMESAEDIPECLYGDEPRMHQVLTNILGNAVKFTQIGGVKLSVSKAGDMLRFEVKDTGRGIKAEDIPLIFDGFSRFGASNSRNAGGTGLGLPITRNLIKLMNGTLSVESEYGKGSTFTVEIPLVPGDKKNIRGAAIVVDSISAPDADVLVVDDNEINLHVAAGLLSICDITCDIAESGAEAIEKIKAKKYDIVFMDHIMPEMDGIEATKLLRKSYNDEELIIIALTANAAGGAKEEMLEAGMNDYLSKPIGKIEMVSQLYRWLPKHKVSIKDPTIDAPDGDTSETGDLFSRFNEIKPLDVAAGLKLLNGSEEDYKKSAEALTKRLLDVVSKLNSDLKNDDLNQFTVELRDVKKSLLEIGAVKLADKAESLELKANDGDSMFCEDNLPYLTAELCELQRKLAEALSHGGEKGGFIGAGDKYDLKDQLAYVRKLLDDFEGDDALELLQDLKLCDYGDELNSLLQQIYQLTVEYDYEDAISIIEGI